MIQRLLVLALAALAFVWWIGRLLGGSARTARRERPAGRGRMTSGGPMVRDRVCNTFLPRASALVLRSGSEEHFFCSERCRDEFSSRRAAAGRTG